MVNRWKESKGIQKTTEIKKTNAFAIVSFCCSLAGFKLLGLFGLSAIVGVVFGHIAKKQIKENPQLGGSGLAIAGLVIGYIIIVLNIIGLIVGITFLSNFDLNFLSNFTESLL